MSSAPGSGDVAAVRAAQRSEPIRAGNLASTLAGPAAAAAAGAPLGAQPAVQGLAAPLGAQSDAKAKHACEQLPDSQLPNFRSGPPPLLPHHY